MYAWAKTVYFYLSLASQYILKEHTSSSILGYKRNMYQHWQTLYFQKFKHQNKVPNSWDWKLVRPPPIRGAYFLRFSIFITPESLSKVWHKELKARPFRCVYKQINLYWPLHFIMVLYTLNYLSKHKFGLILLPSI